MLNHVTGVYMVTGDLEVRNLIGTNLQKGFKISRLYIHVHENKIRCTKHQHFFTKTKKLL